ncbi:lipoyl(octanoyl) transferase [Methylomagnum ishizawai]|uniref:Octanoyltransferase n=1 Tax=Methylomagnum ishizawai TaxID=1760988 RepID=A0A1Y6D2F4_9GAMM|nr:lipoyl(octanoyl) transferase LipB [Methylomagnum ishizawai]SMF97129.1 lipoyl(octanoyl) transferase [Methylomagnum ishizawai]
MSGGLLIRPLGLKDYEDTWRAMRQFTETRGADTPDELWLLEHPPVYTLGMNGDPAHLLRASPIPVVKTDRGGQITYHGPGQLVAYLLADLKRNHLGVRSLVSLLENAAIGLLAQYGLKAVARPDAPGVYVEGRKIASVGLRVRRGCSYHGLSLNVDLDPAPFSAINPCGHAGLEVTSLAALGIGARVVDVMAPLAGRIMDGLAVSQQQR